MNGEALSRHIPETELIGGPLDGRRSTDPWIPVSGMQIRTNSDTKIVALYEWAGVKAEFSHGFPELRYQLRFVGFRRHARRNIIARIIQWFANLACPKSEANLALPTSDVFLLL
jgi:hypothetical protein